MLSRITEKILSFVPEQHRNTAKQFIKFGITGTIGAVVDFGTFGILTRGLNWTTTYNVLGTEVIAANNISVFLAICSNFIINRTWTFSSTEGSAAKQGMGYFILNIFTWTLNQIFVSLFFNWQLFVDLFGDQRDLMAKAAAIIITLFVNFFGSKLFVFRKTEGAK